MVISNATILYIPQNWKDPIRQYVKHREKYLPRFPFTILIRFDVFTSCQSETTIITCNLLWYGCTERPGKWGTSCSLAIICY